MASRPPYSKVLATATALSVEAEQLFLQPRRQPLEVDGRFDLSDHAGIVLCRYEPAEAKAEYPRIRDSEQPLAGVEPQENLSDVDGRRRRHVRGLDHIRRTI